jgi:2-iminobutanoate/2-iminopropanoate deaminase
MECEMVQTDQAPAAVGPYSQAVGAGPFLFVSGQLGFDPETGELVSPDFELQARQALENIRQVILAAGCQLNKVVSVDIFLSNMSNFSKLNNIYEEFFGGHRPARAVVEVSGLPKSVSIEIKCIVYRE